MSEAESEWIDTKVAAELLDRSPRTLEMWRQQNCGPAYRAINGYRVRYRRADVLRWRDENWDVKPTEPKRRNRPTQAGAIAA